MNNVISLSNIYLFATSLYCLLLISSSLFAQSISTPFDSTAYQYAQTITVDELREHLEVLAADEMEGRETGQPGQKKAAQYIADTFQRAGLAAGVGDSTYFQTFPIVETSWDEPYIAVDKQAYTLFEDFFTFPKFADTTTVSFDQVTFAGYGISAERYNDYEGLNVKGKAVVILAGEPMRSDSTYYLSGTKEPSRFTTNLLAGLQTKVETAQAQGARVVLMVDENFAQNVRRFALYAARPSLRLKADTSSISVVFVSPQVAKALVGKRRLAKAQKRIAKTGQPIHFSRPATLTIALRQNVKGVTSENVLGYLEGTDRKDELLVVTSHYDHIGITGDQVNNGADDDGSGTVAVLELAEAFAQAKADGHAPRRSLLFMAVSGEEKGLFGSEYYTDHPVFPIDSTIADLNIDMIGRIDPAHEADSQYVYVIGSDRLSTELHQVNEAANATYTHLNLDYTYNALDDPNRFYYRSDHYNFAKHGIPIIFYFNGTHADYHRPTDTVDKISFDVLRDRARLVFYTAWRLVNQDERLVVDRP